MKLKQLIEELTEIYNEWGDLDIIELVAHETMAIKSDSPSIVYYSEGRISRNPQEGKPIVSI